MAQTDSAADAAVDQAAEDGGLPRINDLILGVGFICMLAWHYLVLFSPVFGDLGGPDMFDYLFNRQLVLYASLCVTFGVVYLVNRRPARSKEGNAPSRHVPSAALVYLVGILSTAVSGFYAFLCGFDVGLTPRLLLVAFLGVAEAVFMFLWLRCFVNKRSERFLRSFALDMIVGAVLAVLVCFLTWPVAPIVAAILPAASAVVLGREAHLDLMQMRNQAEGLVVEAETSGEGNPKKPVDAKAAAAVIDAAKDGAGPGSEPSGSSGARERSPQEKLIARRNRLMTLFVAVYALAFGLLQGVFITAQLPVLMVDNSLIMLGIALAGCIIYFVPKNLNPTFSIDMMHRASLITFIVGAVCVAWFNISDAWLYVAQIALLAGFNLFDFGALVYGIEEGRTGSSQQARVVHQTRSVVYVCMVLGLVVGHLIIGSGVLGDPLFAFVVVCGTSVIVLTATTLAPFYSLDDPAQGADGVQNMRDERCDNCSYAVLPSPIVLPPVAPPKPEVPADWESPWRGACNAIAKLYKLSPRETEIFFLVAKGRNADYIQQELVISTHTAKTHIANIYRKLEVHSSQELLDLVEDFRDSEKK